MAQRNVAVSVVCILLKWLIKLKPFGRKKEQTVMPEKLKCSSLLMQPVRSSIFFVVAAIDLEVSLKGQTTQHTKNKIVDLH